MKSNFILENVIENLSDFIFHNPIAAPQDMRLILQYIQKKLLGENAKFPFQKEKNLWKKALDQLLEDEILQQASRNHPELNGQILQYIANILLQTARKNQLDANLQNQEEEAAFIELDGLPIEILAANYEPYFKTILRYNPDTINLDFYRKKIDLAASKKDIQRLIDLKNYLLGEWRALLDAKILAAELRIIENERANFLLQFVDKIQAYESLKESVRPLTNSEDFGRFWDLGAGAWKKLNTQVLTYYANQLKKNPAIKQIADLLGKLRQSQKEYILEKIKNTDQNKLWKEDFRQKEAYIGLTLSDDIALAMPSELALLGDSLTEDIFIKRWTEKKLQTWEYSSKYLTQQDLNTEKMEKVLKQSDKGPIILCLDTSASMEGKPEQLAKTLCFAIVQMALKEKRPCFLISFSTEIKTLDLHKIQNALPDLIDFLAMSFHGGTDAIPALKKAMELVYTKVYNKADVLMISDFIMDDLPKGIINGMTELRQKFDTAFYCLSIAKDQNESTTSYFDAHWAYNPADKNNLLQLIHALSSRKNI